MNDFKVLNRASLGAKVRCHVHDRATGRRLLSSPWETNLLLDNGLTTMAGGGQGVGGIFALLKTGSGNSANSINTGGSAIFTQVANTVTASSAFFTNAMIGGILKYGATGSAGAEQYITAVAVGGLTCTVGGAGMTVAVAVAGTVWLVQQTTLNSLLQSSSTYSGVGGANGTSYSSNVATLFRTFVFASPGSTQNINEIGYSPTGVAGATVSGRIVLGSTVVVTTAQFLVCELTMTYTQAPGAPLAVTNVGTNFDTSGTFMCQAWNISQVGTNGVTQIFTPTGSSPANGCVDATTPPTIAFHLANDITPAASIGTTVAAVGESLKFNFAALSTSGLPAGNSRTAVAAFSTTTSGQTVYAIIFSGNTTGQTTQAQNFVLVLTTPFVLPVGTFQGSWQFFYQFTRALIN